MFSGVNSIVSGRVVGVERIPFFFLAFCFLLCWVSVGRRVERKEEGLFLRRQGDKIRVVLIIRPISFFSSSDARSFFFRLLATQPQGGRDAALKMSYF